MNNYEELFKMLERDHRWNYENLLKELEDDLKTAETFLNEYAHDPLSKEAFKGHVEKYKSLIKLTKAEINKKNKKHKITK